MRLSRLRSRLPALLAVSTVTLAASVLLSPLPALAATDAGAVISNGTVQLGVNALGDLNYDCDGNEDVNCPGPSAAPNSPSGRVGLRYAADNLESIADGSPAEGWGVADATTEFTGYVNEDSGNSNVSLDTFSATDTGATSVVNVGGGRGESQALRVTQAYAPSPSSEFVYSDTVTIENTGSDPVGDLRYRRTVDWDIEPSAFNEWVTAGGSSPELLFNSDDGFASSDPLAGNSYDQSESVCDAGYSEPCQYTDLGAGGVYPDVTQAADHGALYDFGLGTLDAGESRTLTVFYGAAPDEKTATDALNAAGAQVYSLGESACTLDAVPDCEPTPPGDGDGGGGDGCGRDCARGAAAAAPAAEAPPTGPVGVTLGEPATFMLGFATSSADLAISQTDDPDPVDVGNQLTYDLAVTNTTGNEATGVHVEDTLPSGVTLESATPEQGTCTGTTTVSCELGTIGDATVHIAIVVTPTEPGTVTNTAVVSSATGDPDLSNNTSQERTVIQVPLPVANDDSYSTPEDTALTVPAANGLLKNDTDPNGGSLVVASGSASAPSHGTVTVDPDGSFTYTPGPGYDGTDSFTYRVTNGEQTSAPDTPGTVTITVTPVNDPPVAVADAYTTAEDTTLTVAAPGVLGNDTDPEGSPLTAVLVGNPTHGALTVGTDGKVTYTPAPNYHGPDSFTYQASDGALTSAVTTVTLTVTPVDDPIVARDDSYTVAQGVTLTVDAPGVLGNDTDVDGRAEASTLTQPEHGTVSLAQDGSFVYTPVATFRGDDSFIYTAGDGTRATVTITVSPVNHAPVAADDAYAGNEDNPITHNAATGVLGNDTDPDDDNLSVVVVKGPTHGALTLQSDGSFSYVPEANYNGDDSFTYQASDGTLTSNVATVTLTIEPIDDAPVAVPDDYSTPEDTTLTVDAPGILANDSDVDGDTLFPVLDGQPGHGTLELGNSDHLGAFTYVPNAGFTGTDTFTYHLSSNETTSATVTVTLHVTPVNHPPVAVANSYATSHATTLTVPAPGVLANDTDPDGNALSAALVSGPGHGTVTLGANGRVVYVPNSTFTGTDSFRYRVTDGLAESPSVAVRIAVGAPVVPPSTPPTTPTTPPPSTPTSAVPVPPTVPSDSPTPPVDTPTTPDVPTETPTAPSTPSSTPPPTTPPTSKRTLRLTAPSVIPGGPLRAAGTGCAPNTDVQLTIAGRAAGSGSADGDGHFDVPVTTTGLEVGTYPVTATCGDRQLVADVALVYVTADSNAPTAQALVVAAALAFFLLLLGLVIRRPTS